MLKIVGEVQQEYYLDSSRIYAVGHSRGAGCVALFAVLSGGMNIASGVWNSPFAAYGVVPFTYGQALADSLSAAGWCHLHLHKRREPHLALAKRQGRGANISSHSGQSFYPFPEPYGAADGGFAP